MGDSRKNESITVDPVGILRVECHELVEEDMGGRSHAHGRARVTGVRFEGGIDLQRRRRDGQLNPEV